jgi:four helix bundle protein
MRPPRHPKVRSFRDLVAWQKAIRLAREVYVLTDLFPKHELYGMTAQMRRAAVSIPANIAEGHARRTTKDYIRFLSIATGSLRELETCTEISTLIGLVSRQQLEPVSGLANEVGALLARLSFSLSSKLRLPLIP